MDLLKRRTVMPNTNAPFGFRQYSGTGSAPTYEQVTVRIAFNASAIFYGDPVMPDANGFVVVGAPGTTQIAGIFQGCKYLSVSQKRTVWSNYWPGTDVASGQTVEGYIINDPNAKFLAQTGSTGATNADINANVNFAIGTGNTATGVSGAFVDMATVNTTNTLPFRIVSLDVDPPGAPGTDTGAFNYVVVAFNNVSGKQLTGI
jgi:hypothetical protein